jgi:predicted permease
MIPSGLRFVIRTLLKSPVFSSVAILSLAIGIGANTSVFTLLDQVLIRMLPVERPEELVQLRELGAHYGSNTGMNALSYPIYKDFSEQNEVFSGMLCRARERFSVSYAGRSERAAGELVSGTYFPVLGVGAVLGRTILPDDDRAAGASPVAVLSYDYWATRFAKDPAIIGKELLVNNHKLTVIGVAQPNFDGVEALFASQIYAPMAMAPQLTDENKPLENRRRRWVQVFARLKPGVGIPQAQAAMQPIFKRILQMEVQAPEFAQASAYTRRRFLEMTLDVMPGGGGQNIVKRFLTAPLWAMMAMVALVLLIACANVANLMIARAASRQKEIAVRLALGAGRARIVRQLLLESGLIALAGAVLGLAFTPLIMRFLTSTFPDMDPPLKLALTPDARALWFTLAVTALTALIFGLAPALQSTRPSLAPTLKEQAGAVAGGGQSRWRKGLVSLQVSLSLLLLIGAGLFVRSLRNLQNVSAGFEVTNLLSFQLDPTLNGYDAERAKLLYRNLNEKLAAMPGAESAALVVVTLLAYGEWDSTVTVEGYTPKPGEDMNPYVNYVSPGFFETLKIPIYSGRGFNERDSVGARKVAVVNESFARHYFGERGAVGRRLGMGGNPGTKTDIEIVGVVRDTRYTKIRDDPPRQVYFPYLQNTWASQMTAYIRTTRSSEQMFPEIRALMRQIDANVPVLQMKTVEHQRDDSLAIERFAASLSTAFSGLATVLAAIGLYGVMAFLVARRTREIGIRMALGALPANVLWLVMREVLMLTGAGVLIGLPAGIALARLIASQLYEITPTDPVTISAATLVIAAIAAVAGYWPARRATRIQPVTALRYE